MTMSIEPGATIEWDDDSGMRRYLVLQVGRRNVRLFYLPLVRAYTVPADSLRRQGARVVPAKATVQRRIIRENLAERRRLGLRASASAAKLALGLLRAP